jgi:hypothetical protein
MVISSDRRRRTPPRVLAEDKGLGHHKSVFQPESALDLKSPYRIEKTDDPRIVTISIDLDALPIKPNLGEPDAVRLVLAALAARNPSPAAAEALERIETPEALHTVFAVAGAAEEVSDDLRAALHQQWTVRGHRIREAVNDDEVMASILRRCLPAYEGPPLIVYRGEQAERAERGQVGFNWAADRKVGEMFASGLCTLYPGGGVLLQATATVDAVISGSSAHSAYLGENELVVEPSRLTGVTVLARYPAADS